VAQDAGRTGGRRATDTPTASPCGRVRRGAEALWFAGLDRADQYHDVVVLDEHGTHAAALRVPHTAEGVGRLTASLLDLSAQARPSACPERVACLVETTNGLLISALLEAGLFVSPVNPKTVDRLRPPSGVKTDAHGRAPLGAQGAQRLAGPARAAAGRPPDPGTGRR